VEDRECEELVVEWIEQVTGESKGMLSVAEWLRSGQVLCGLVNKIKPRLIKVGKMLSPHHKKDNIKKFLKVAARDFGLPEKSLFSPADLYEERNMARVVACVLALAEVVPRVAPQFQGPSLGSLSFGGAARALLLMATPGVDQASVMPPQSFTPYRENFSSIDAAAWSDIHAMFNKSKPSNPLDGIEELSTEAGSESGCESLVDDGADAPPVSKRLLPSMGVFHGAGGLFGGALRLNPVSKVHQDVLVEASIPEAEASVIAAHKSFLPSMGGFHGASGRYGGVRLVSS